jgi:excinuclease UvrABC nuclease subunit
VVFYITFIRNGKLVGGNGVIVKEILYEPTLEFETINTKEKICSNFVCQYYSKNEIPDSIFLITENNLFSNDNLSNINKYLVSQLPVESKIKEKFYVNKELFLKKNKLNKKFGMI